MVNLQTHLFGKYWDEHSAKLVKLARDEANAEMARQTSKTLAQGGLAWRQQGGPRRQGRGDARIPADRVPLRAGGSHITEGNYPGMPPPPRHVCRGWWADGVCNIKPGYTCSFGHDAPDQARGQALRRQGPRA